MIIECRDMNWKEYVAIDREFSPRAEDDILDPTATAQTAGAMVP